MPKQSEDVVDSAGKFAGTNAPGMLAGTRVVAVEDNA